MHNRSILFFSKPFTDVRHFKHRLLAFRHSGFLYAMWFVFGRLGTLQSKPIRFTWWDWAKTPGRFSSNIVAGVCLYIKCKVSFKTEYTLPFFSFEATASLVLTDEILLLSFSPLASCVFLFWFFLFNQKPRYVGRNNPIRFTRWDLAKSPSLFISKFVAGVCLCIKCKVSFKCWVPVTRLHFCWSCGSACAHRWSVSVVFFVCTSAFCAFLSFPTKKIFLLSGERGCERWRTMVVLFVCLVPFSFLLGIYFCLFWHGRW